MSGVPAYMVNVVACKAPLAQASNFAAHQSILNPTDVYTAPPNYFSFGQNYVLKAAGAIGNVVTAVPTIQLDLYIGSVAAWSSGALACKATASTALSFDLEVLLRLDSEGSGTAAKLMGLGRIICAALGTPALAVPSTPALGTGFDSTTANTIDLHATWSAQSTSNTVICQLFTLDQKRFGS